MGAADTAFQKVDIYGTEDGPAFLSGIQALVRLPMVQRRLDRSQGLDTAGLVSGYRGSPLGGYDQQPWKAAAALKAHDIVFQPGLNEDLAATALWGAQMHRAFGPAKVDGVFGIWYGKGPGIDRTRHARAAARVVLDRAHRCRRQAVPEDRLEGERRRSVGSERGLHRGADGADA